MDKREPLSAEECERLGRSGAILPTEGQKEILQQMYWREGVPMTWEEFDRICQSGLEELTREAEESMAEDLARIAKEKAEKEQLKKEKAKARRKKA